MNYEWIVTPTTDDLSKHDSSLTDIDEICTQNYGNISLESFWSESQKDLNGMKAGGVLWKNMIRVCSQDSNV